MIGARPKDVGICMKTELTHVLATAVALSFGVGLALAGILVVVAGLLFN